MQTVNGKAKWMRVFVENDRHVTRSPLPCEQSVRQGYCGFK
jgi:hypothetical protein